MPTQVGISARILGPESADSAGCEQLSKRAHFAKFGGLGMAGLNPGDSQKNQHCGDEKTFLHGETLSRLFTTRSTH